MARGICGPVPGPGLGPGPGEGPGPGPGLGSISNQQRPTTWHSTGRYTGFVSSRFLSEPFSLFALRADHSPASLLPTEASRPRCDVVPSVKCQARSAAPESASPAGSPKLAGGRNLKEVCGYVFIARGPIEVELTSKPWPLRPRAFVFFVPKQGPRHCTLILPHLYVVVGPRLHWCSVQNTMSRVVVALHTTHRHRHIRRTVRHGGGFNSTVMASDDIPGGCDPSLCAPRCASTGGCSRRWRGRCGCSARCCNFIGQRLSLAGGRIVGCFRGSPGGRTERASGRGVVGGALATI